jgi:2-hydroxy-3-keto-5-methylthiopentenyl-1-phosphate phosphatase
MTCGEPCKRGSLAGEPYVYVGDGYSDRCAALAADRVFARDALARHLDALGVVYEPFDDLRDVAAGLAK